MSKYNNLIDLSGEPATPGIAFRDGFDVIIAVVYGLLITVPWVLLGSVYAPHMPLWKQAIFAACIIFVTYKTVWRVLAYRNIAIAWVRYSRLTLFLKCKDIGFQNPIIPYMLKYNHQDVMKYLTDPANEDALVRATDADIQDMMQMAGLLKNSDNDETR